MKNGVERRGVRWASARKKVKTFIVYEGSSKVKIKIKCLTSFLAMVICLSVLSSAYASSRQIHGDSSDYSPDPGSMYYFITTVSKFFEEPEVWRAIDFNGDDVSNEYYQAGIALYNAQEYDALMELTDSYIKCFNSYEIEGVPVTVQEYEESLADINGVIDLQAARAMEVYWEKENYSCLTQSGGQEIYVTLEIACFQEDGKFFDPGLSQSDIITLTSTGGSITDPVSFHLPTYTYNIQSSKVTISTHFELRYRTMGLIVHYGTFDCGFTVLLQDRQSPSTGYQKVHTNKTPGDYVMSSTPQDIVNTLAALMN